MPLFIGCLFLFFLPVVFFHQEHRTCRFETELLLDEEHQNGPTFKPYRSNLSFLSLLSLMANRSLCSRRSSHPPLSCKSWNTVFTSNIVTMTCYCFAHWKQNLNMRSVVHVITTRMFLCATKFTAMSQEFKWHLMYENNVCFCEFLHNFLFYWVFWTVLIDMLNNSQLLIWNLKPHASKGSHSSFLFFHLSLFDRDHVQEH